MSKSTLVSAIADDFPTKAEAERAIDAVTRGIAAVVTAGGSVTLSNFGSFKQKHRAERMGRNPRTGEPIRIGARNELVFKPSRTL